jgi:hypothetical protein
MGNEKENFYHRTEWKKKILKIMRTKSCKGLARMSWAMQLPIIDSLSVNGEGWLLELPGYGLSHWLQVTIGISLSAFEVGKGFEPL